MDELKYMGAMFAGLFTLAMLTELVKAVIWAFVLRWVLLPRVKEQRW